MRVVLDANFLMIPGQFGIDVFGEIRRILGGSYTLAVPEAVVIELVSISRGKSKDAKAAKLALQLVEKKNVHIVPHHEKKADSAIEEMASEGDTVVATQDKPLQSALRKRGTPLITMKGRAHLELEGM
ncbi:MAG: nucleotide-binding protein [Candidatus Aenigmatarchaeota archaeon]|nr:MAG: nucleotide-binding protein [Candidatus Aenigmarchaeota archaeon]